MAARSLAAGAVRIAEYGANVFADIAIVPAQRHDRYEPISDRPAPLVSEETIADDIDGQDKNYLVGSTIPGSSEYAHMRQSLKPDSSTLMARNLAERFRSSLSILLSLNIIFYAFETFTGVALIPSGQDLLLLLLGWFGQDHYRPSTLDLYTKLSLLSVAVDFIGFVANFVVIIQNMGFHWVIWVLFLLFAIENGFKAASVVHARRLRYHIIRMKARGLDHV